MEKILIAADHGGYDLKERIKSFTFSKALEWIDLGTYSKESTDFPDYAYALVQAINEGQADKGILICRTGIGMSIAANRHPDIRAAVCSDTTMAKYTRMDNDSNVLCLGGSTMGDRLIEDVIETFLTTEFVGDQPGSERHRRRVEKLNITAE